MNIIKSLLSIALCLLFAIPALAQSGGGQGMGPGPGQGQGRGLGPGGGMGRGMGPMMYNPQNVTTIKGVTESPGQQMGRMHQVSWVVKTDKDKVTVHLGPAWYVDQQQFSLKPGDTIEVTGSLVERSGTSFLVAKEVKAGGKTLKLRDDQGLPVWRGQGRQQPQ